MLNEAIKMTLEHVGKNIHSQNTERLICYGTPDIYLILSFNG
jgi:hypothetical protein